MDLSTFLLARIDRDEAEARLTICVLDEPRGHWFGLDGTSTSNHWDPARVLAECEAKRRIVAEFQNYPRSYCLRLLTLPYADHPDFDPEWKP